MFQSPIKIVFEAIIYIGLLGTSNSFADYSNFVIKSCASSKKTQCDESCTGGDFKECYVDPSYASPRLAWKKDCYAIHVGRSCPPCENVFSVNGGGSFRKVSCEYFYSALERKNKQCGDCLQLITHFEIDPSELEKE